MPLDISESWEYFEPDPEVAEAMAEDGGVALTDADFVSGETTKHLPVGISYGKGDPDVIRFHLAPRSKPGVHPRLARKLCEKCGYSFQPDRASRLFCSDDCRLAVSAGRPPRKANKVCANPECGKLFYPREQDQKYCCRTCFLGWGNTGRPVKLSMVTCPCGKTFKPRRHGQRHCSLSCSNRYRKAFKDKPNMHRHRCEKCKTIWTHGNDCWKLTDEEHDLAHTCTCGEVVWDKYWGDLPPTKGESDGH